MEKGMKKNNHHNNSNNQVRPKKLMFLGAVVNVFEWYEFSVFIYLSAVMGYVFWGTDGIKGILFTLSVFMTSYCARPLGAWYFGRLSKKLGAGRVLNLTLWLMAVPTVLIGLMPTYQAVGIFATLELVILRFMQGFAVGGELPVGSVFMFESSDNKRSGFIISFVSAGSITGLLLGSGVAAALVGFLSQDDLYAWGWRVPFLLGIPMALFIFKIRMAIHREFSTNTVKPKEIANDKPLAKANRVFLWGVGIALIGALQVQLYTLFVWLPTYNNVFLDYLPVHAKTINTLAMVALVAGILIVGYSSQRLGTWLLLKAGFLANALVTIPGFYILIMYAPNIEAIIIAYGVFVVSASLSFGTIVKTLCDLAPPYERALMVCITYTWGSAFFGGVTPWLSMMVVTQTNFLWFPALWITLSALLAWVIMKYVEKRADMKTHEELPVVDKI